MNLSVRAAITKYCRPSSLKNSCGGLKAKIKVSVGLASYEGLSHWLVDGCLHAVSSHSLSSGLLFVLMFSL